MIIQIRKLGKVSHLFANLRITDFTSQQVDLAGSGIKEIQQDLDGCTFTCTIGPQETKDLTLLNLQGKPLKCHFGLPGQAIPVDLGDFLKAESGGHFSSHTQLIFSIANFRKVSRGRAQLIHQPMTGTLTKK
jgi:hypothetical protein